MAIQQDNNVLAKDIFQKLSQARKAYVDRAIKNAKVTIPMLFREETDDGNKALDDLYSSIGARGVNNLTSKLMLALFPPNEKFFRLGLTPEMKGQLIGHEDKIAEVEQQLMQIEDTIIRSIEENQIRITIQEGILQLLVTGNCLLFLPPKENGSRLYNLHDYVVERDAIGNVLRIVTRDKLTKRSLMKAPKMTPCLKSTHSLRECKILLCLSKNSMENELQGVTKHSQSIRHHIFLFA